MTFFNEDGPSLLGALTALVLPVIGGGMWVGRIATRVSALEKRMDDMEDDTLTELKTVRDEIKHVIADLHRAREDALVTFAGGHDLRRLEDKVDSISVNLAELRPKARRGLVK